MRQVSIDSVSKELIKDYRHGTLLSSTSRWTSFSTIKSKKYISLRLIRLKSKSLHNLQRVNSKFKFLGEKETLDATTAAITAVFNVAIGSGLFLNLLM